MFTKIEIDGFKSFREFSLDLGPFSAVVGPNASGKSNLFDAIKFLSHLAQGDVGSAMRSLRGEPSELFRTTPSGAVDQMKFAVEVLLPPDGEDSFGNIYKIKGQRLRYEISIAIRKNKVGWLDGAFVSHEHCRVLKPSNDTSNFARALKPSYSQRKLPLLETKFDSQKQVSTFLIRQDGDSESGVSKRGRPVVLSAAEASTSALSTVSNPEFEHLYALRQFFASIRFLEINPNAARASNDRFESKELRPDASNLSAVLSRLKNETASAVQPMGVISDISADLTSLIPSVKSVIVNDGADAREYSFSVEMSDGQIFSSRVISDGTLRLLALIAILNDPNRNGILCFEEPENGVHEGRIPRLIELLRSAAEIESALDPIFQILLNTHSPAVMSSLRSEEIIAADSVNVFESGSKIAQRQTRMRTGVRENTLFDEETDLTRRQVDKLLKWNVGGV
jgi:predicted ATPase